MAATSKQTMKYAFGPYFSIVLQFSAFYDPPQTTGKLPRPVSSENWQRSLLPT
jgi:hypothetical protein